MHDDPKSESPQSAPQQDDAESKPTPSAEDQMAAYEEDLKNTDWGHQPC